MEFHDGKRRALFNSFSAVVDNTAVSVNWQLRSQRSMADYHIYRSEGGGQSVEVCNGAVSQMAGAYLDRGVEPDRRYRYEIRVRTTNGSEFRSTTAVATPALELQLKPNHPNPFNPQTTIPYNVPSGRGSVHVRLLVYDTAGRTVRVLVNDDQNAGAREVVWNGLDDRGTAVSSGVYYCVLQVGSERRTRKMVLLK
jgi:hypothetical protein